MNVDDDFYAMWRQTQEKVGEDELPLCAIAQRFSEKLQEVIFTPLSQGYSRRQITQAKYMLQEEWQAWKRAVPLSHQKAALKKHRCLYEVYDAAYDRLQLLELTIKPPVEVIVDYDEITKKPEPPALPEPAPKPPEIAGIFIGEMD
jgi:hypothetical protein